VFFSLGFTACHSGAPALLFFHHLSIVRTSTPFRNCQPLLKDEAAFVNVISLDSSKIDGNPIASQYNHTFIAATQSHSNFDQATPRSKVQRAMYGSFKSIIKSRICIYLSEKDSAHCERPTACKSEVKQGNEHFPSFLPPLCK